MDVSATPNLIFALGAGFLTGLTPCVYPMIPITLAIFGAKAGTPRARAIALAIAYDAGIALMFGALGSIVSATGKPFGAYLASPWLVVPLALFFVAMGLSMFGAFEVSLPSGLQARLSRVGGKGFLGAFMMGLVGGLIAAPCTGPALFALLTFAALDGHAAAGFALLSTYGAGVGLPLCLLAGFSAAMPRPGAWMDWVKSFFGVMLFMAALYYLKNVVPPLAHFASPSPRFIIAMAAMIIAGVALGAIHATFYGGVAEKIRKGAGVALVTLGLFGAVNYALTPKGNVQLVWLSDERAAVADARAAGRPLIVDFAADWCLPCKEFDVRVFSRPEVANEMRRFTLLRVDLTNGDDDPQLAAIKKKYAADTLPAVRIVSSDGAIVARTDELIPPERFLALLSAAR
jgi:thioredoxin:protein disulfide reductase